MNTVVSVASLASASAIAAPAIAEKSASDPIFALIERHRAAAAYYKTTSPDIDRDEDDAAELADCEALCDLIGTAPTTLAGCAAVLRYFSDYLDEDDGPIGHWIEPFRTAGANFMPTIAGAIEELLRQHAAILGVLAVLPPVAHADSELLALDKKLKAANKRLKKASKEKNEANERMERAAALLPPIPQAPEPPSEYAHLWTKAPQYEFKALPSDHPIVVWERETRDQRDVAWKMRCDRSDELSRQCGYDEAHARWEHILHRKMLPLARKIWAIPAQTAEGMRIKLTAATLAGFVDLDIEREDEYWRSIRKDIRRLAKQQRALV